MKSNRIVSIDIVRGIAIFLMVMSANIAWGSGLPAWMFHCQVPPPDFIFNPDIKGITWVDLVFPFFIFSMGASMPFSLGGKLRKGQSVGKVSVGIIKRWLTLAAFGLVLGNSGLILSYTDAGKTLLRLGIWAGMFLALWRVPSTNKRGWIINLAGLIAVLCLLIVEKAVFGAKLSFHSINIIIMILSMLALLGGFTWLITRDKLWLRAVLLLLVCALKEICWHTEILKGLAFPNEISWLLSWKYAQYIVVLMIGMTAGDILMKANLRNEALCAKPESAKSIIVAIAEFAIIPLIVWALYKRYVWVALDITILLGIFSIYFTREWRNTPNILIMRIGYIALALGILFDPIDGGITKDHCNLSYMLTTGGLACMLTSALLWIESALGKKERRLRCGFDLVGQNPMFAYTLSSFILNPLYYACGLGAIVDGDCQGNPFMGIVRGLIITLAMMALTCFMSKKKIYWRS